MSRLNEFIKAPLVGLSALALETMIKFHLAIENLKQTITPGDYEQVSQDIKENERWRLK
jgi:hypothetical protein